MRIKLEKFKDKGWNWSLHYGYPQDEHYDNHNTKLYHVFDVAPQEILSFAEQNFQKNYSIAMIKQLPGQFIPRHKDKHYKYKSKNKNFDKKKISRYCIFLEDWKPGHYLEYDDKPIDPWKKGDIIVIEQGVYHRSVNAGTTPKYTAQITGLLK
jgi:quercetin dioxygenase-like cupin family protein